MSTILSIRDSRQLKALTGASEERSEKSKEKFGEVYEDLRGRLMKKLSDAENVKEKEEVAVKAHFRHSTTSCCFSFFI